MKRIFAFVLSVLLLVLMTGCMYTDEAPEASEIDVPVQKLGVLDVHYIDVGQADAILVVGDDVAMLIDAGNNDDGKAVCQYIRSIGVDFLDYLVVTHAHEDHAGGMDTVIRNIDAAVIMLPQQEMDTKTYTEVVDAAKKKNLEIRRPMSGDTFQFGKASVQVLGPVKKDYENLNDSSIVLKLVFGKTSFLFTGDLKREGEADILKKGFDLQADVYKVSHHGSGTSTSYVFLREIMPTYAVISLGADNPYGHPHEETMSRLSDAGVTVYRTDLQGTVVASSDGEKVSMYTQRKVDPTYPRQDISEQSEMESDAVYIGNVKSQKFHLNTCDSLPKKENRIYFSTRQAALDAGYEPCGGCNP